MSLDIYQRYPIRQGQHLVTTVFCAPSFEDLTLRCLVLRMNLQSMLAALLLPRTRKQEVARDQLVSYRLNMTRTYIASQEDVVRSAKKKWKQIVRLYIQCDLCVAWIHATCKGLSDEMYDSIMVLGGLNNVLYYCDTNYCISHIKQLLCAFLNLEKLDKPNLLYSRRVYQNNLMTFHKKLQIYLQNN